MAFIPRKSRKKKCPLCEGKTFTYKDAELIRRFYMTEKGKIASRRSTGACAKHQREIAHQVKLARFMAFVPYVGK
ncbi:MAG: 30S ribosomal protein S18 [Bacilli bacterium]